MPNILEAIGLIVVSFLGMLVAEKARLRRLQGAGVLGILYGLYSIVANIWIAISSIFTPVVSISPTVIPTQYLPPPTFAPTPISSPAPMGIPVNYQSLQITLLNITTHDLIYTGEDIAFYPQSGDKIIDLGVLVRNSGATVAIKWKDIGIMESNGSAWYPNFCGEKTVSYGQIYDPFNIKISETQEEQFASFANDTYIRLIFYVKNVPQNILFTIKDSPSIVFRNP